MKKTILLLFTLVCVICYGQNTAETDSGVVINGVKWATRNVDEPGKFASSPENAGKFYQWNKNKAWNTTGDSVSGWDNSHATGNTWGKTNNPCPTGWRVPNRDELQRLIDEGSTWTTINGVNGRLFGTAPNQIFLPAAGWRSFKNGALNDAGSHGAYWSSSEDGGQGATHLGFINIFENMYSGLRAIGHTIRCVAED